MKIEAIVTKDNKPRYFLKDNKNGTVAYFDTLTAASLVLRYLSGDRMMSQSDCKKARKHIEEYEAGE